jgi:hypothetical protein
VNWMALSDNPAAIHLLKANQKMILKNGWFASNPAIFEPRIEPLFAIIVERALSGPCGCAEHSRCCVWQILDEAGKSR